MPSGLSLPREMRGYTEELEAFVQVCKHKCTIAFTNDVLEALI